MEQKVLELEGSLGALLEDDLSVPQRVFRRVWELESEVNNGGFEQYILNGSGQYATQAVEALAAIGALNCAAIVREALAMLGPQFPWNDEAARHSALEAMGDAASDALEPFDTSFLAYPDDLTALLYAFVDQHADEFDGV